MVRYVEHRPAGENNGCRTVSTRQPTADGGDPVDSFVGMIAMNDVPPISTQRTTLGRIEANRTTGQPAANRPQRPGDSVELSPVANLLSRLNQLPDVREDLVRGVRDRIDAGTYETPQKVDAAIDRLAEEEALL